MNDTIAPKRGDEVIVRIRGRFHCKGKVSEDFIEGGLVWYRDRKTQGLHCARIGDVEVVR